MLGQNREPVTSFLGGGNHGPVPVTDLLRRETGSHGLGVGGQSSLRHSNQDGLFPPEVQRTTREGWVVEGEGPVFRE